MAFYNTLSYVTNGLYLMLDAGNTSSYPGTGTTWSDISGNGRHFTLRNASAYTNGYAGNSLVKYMNFNSTSAYSTGGDLNPGDTNGITLCVWTRMKHITTDWRTLIRGGVNDHQVIVSTGHQLGMYDNANGSGFNDSGFNVQNIPGYPTVGSVPNTNLSTNQQWTMMVWKWQNANPYYQFQLDNNPNVLGSISSANARFKNGFTELGAVVNSGSQYWGDIAVFMMYNRLLTQAEINRNYDTFAPRFNGGTNTTAGTTSRTINVFPGIVPVPDANAPGATLISDGTSGFWAYPGATSGTPATGFRYRSTFTHGYLAAGYKGSNPWRAVNKTWHSTDMTIYCGEQLDKAGAYIDGTWSDYNGYVHATNDAFQGSSTHTSSYSLANGTMRARGESTYSPSGSGFGFPTSTGTSGVGGWNMGSGRSGGPAGGVNQSGQVGYIAGGGASAVDKFHFASEIMYAGPDSGAAYGNSTVAHGQNYGWYPLGGTKKYLTWSNDTWTAWSGSSTNADGWSHILSTKWGHHYGGGGNVTSPVYKFSDSTGADLASYTKIRAYGEENFQMGQDWGYMLGNYDGQQNNHTVKTIYANDAMVQLGTAAQPKGHFGQSSGTCSSAAASVCIANASVGF